MTDTTKAPGISPVVKGVIFFVCVVIFISLYHIMKQKRMAGRLSGMGNNGEKAYASDADSIGGKVFFK